MTSQRNTDVTDNQVEAAYQVYIACLRKGPISRIEFRYILEAARKALHSDRPIPREPTKGHPNEGKPVWSRGDEA